MRKYYFCIISSGTVGLFYSKLANFSFPAFNPKKVGGEVGEGVFFLSSFPYFLHHLKTFEHSLEILI